MRYLNESGDEIVDPDTIASHYFRGEFKFDVISNFPLWIFALATNDWQRYYGYLSLLQLLRIKKLRDIYTVWSNILDTNIMLVLFSENAFHIIIKIQISACLWFSLACSGAVCSSDTWVETRKKRSKYYFSAV